MQLLLIAPPRGVLRALFGRLTEGAAPILLGVLFAPALRGGLGLLAVGMMSVVVTGVGGWCGDSILSINTFTFINFYYISIKSSKIILIKNYCLQS